MNELDEIYILLNSEYEKQKKKTILHLNNCLWLSDDAKEKSINLMSPDGALAYTARGFYTKYLYLDNGKHLEPQLYENICMEIQPLESLMEEFVLGNSANGYVKSYCWIIGIYAACAKYFWMKDKKISIDASMSSIRLLSGLNAINIYRNIVKMERKKRLERQKISAKGGNTVARLAKIFRMESIRLLDKYASEGKFWSSLQEAADTIESELWQFIESKRNEGYKTNLKQETLNEAILRWARGHSDIKLAIERGIKKKK